MAKQTQKEPEKKVTRTQAASRVVAQLNGKASLSELAKKADALFVQSGGNSNLESAKASVRLALETAEELGVVRLTKPTDILVEMVK